MFKKWLKLYKKWFKSSRLFLFFKNLKKKKKTIKKNLKDFTKEEKREVKELLSGEESVKKYFSDTTSIFKDYFIPGDSNDNRPKILRPKQLTIIATLLVVLKIVLVGYVFSVYQEKATMSPDIANQVFVLTNESRVQNGSNPLLLNPALTQAAQLKAEDMIINNYFSHTSVDGRRPWDFVNRSAYPYLLVGENLAMNFVAASDAHSALMTSPSHRKNILNSKYTDVGIYATSGVINGEETNVLVEIFAYKKDVVETYPEADTSSDDTLSAVEQEAEEEDDNSEKPNSFVLSQSGSNSNSNNPDEIAGQTEDVISDYGIDNLDDNEADAEYDEAMESYQEVNIQRIEEVEATSSPDSLVQAIETSTVATTDINTTTDEVNNVDSSEIAVATSTEAIGVDSINGDSTSTLAQRPVSVVIEKDQETRNAVKLMDISKIVYVVFLLVLIVILIMNILVRVTVQHKSVIIQTVLLLILILALIALDFDFMDKLREASESIILF